MYDIYKQKDAGRECNCQKQTVAFELNMRGIKCVPLAFNPYYELDNQGNLVKKADGKGYLTLFNLPNDLPFMDYPHYSKTLEAVRIDNSSYNSPTHIPMKIKEHLSNFPNTRWAVSVRWRGKDAGRHIFNIIVDDNGKTTFIDTQSNTKVTHDNCWRLLSMSYDRGDTVLFRTDNRELDQNLLKQFVKEIKDNG